MRSVLLPVARTSKKSVYLDPFGSPVSSLTASENTIGRLNAFSARFLCRKTNVVELAFCEGRGPSANIDFSVHPSSWVGCRMTRLVPSFVPDHPPITALLGRFELALRGGTRWADKARGRVAWLLPEVSRITPRKRRMRALGCIAQRSRNPGKRYPMRLRMAASLTASASVP